MSGEGQRAGIGISMLRVEAWALVLAAAAFLSRLALIPVRFFDQDEFQHIHIAWSFVHGVIPYRDFFDNHTPGLSFLLAPLFALVPVERDPTLAIRSLMVARALMAVFALGVLALSWLLARRNGRPLAALAVLLLSNNLLFLQASLEIRPDVPAAFAFLIGLLGFMRGLDRIATDDDKGAALAFFAGGFAVGTGILFTPKLLLGLPGLGLGLLAVSTGKGRPGTLRRVFFLLPLAAVGALAPLLAMLVFFGTLGAAGEFFRFGFLVNFGWKFHVAPWPVLQQLVRQNVVILLFAAVGLVATWRRVSPARPNGAARDLVWLLPLVSFVGGIFLVPAAYPQYYLLFLPLLSLLAARGVLLAVAGAVKAMSTARRQHELRRTLLVLGFASLAFLLIDQTQLPLAAISAWFGFPLAREVGLLLFAFALLGWRRRVAMAVLCVALSLGPLRQMRDAKVQRNDHSLRGIRKVMELTGPEDRCMDGWTGWAVFRPHAWRHFCLFWEIRSMLTEQEKSELLEKLERGSVAPRLLLYDDDLRNVSPGVTSFFERHYERTEDDPIWLRRTSR